ncbi:MAG: radical SAM/SPASM domain-containing protein [Candidatus Zixiibacteriota bacterium]
MKLPGILRIIWKFKDRYTLRRIFNFFLSYISEVLSYILKKPIVWGAPVWVMIEPTNMCNLKCPACPSRADARNFTNGKMDMDVYRSIIDRIHKKSIGVFLAHRGEPFVHPEFLEMVEYARKKNLIVRTSSNMHFIKDKETACNLVKAGMDWMIVALDGITQEIYSRYRRGGNLQTVLNAMKYIAQCKEELGKKTPHLMVQFLLFGYNEHQIEDARRLSYEIGADGFYLKTVQVFGKMQGDDLLPKNPKYRRYETDKNSELSLKIKHKNRCKRIWRYLTIEWDGRIVPCCIDSNWDFPIADVREGDLDSWWKNDDYMKFREKVLKDRMSIKMCTNCMEGVPLYLNR